MENMNEKMMEHEMDMVDGIWMDENEAANLASCLPHYYIMVSLKSLMVFCRNRQLMAVVTQKDTERLWRRAFTGRPGVVG